MLHSSPSHVKARTEAGVLILTILDQQVTGEEQCLALREELLDAVGHGPNKIIVDFQQVEYVSSVAFRPLLSLHRRVHQIGGRLVLCNLQPLVVEVFQATGLLIDSRALSVFEEQPTLAAAIAAVNA